VGRCPEPRVRSIELEAGGTAAGEPEVAEDLVRHAIEDPRDPRIS
jgi:hypothetical protein